MFGIMRPQGCGTSDAAKEHHRLHYCGTCKAMGSDYGQASRLLLNFDTVFLSEILSRLSTENTAQWESALHSHNCFAMPKDAPALPLALRYAAATNVVLTEFKVDDNLHDSGGFRWRFTRGFFTRAFRKAEQSLGNWGVNVADLWAEARRGQAREKGMTLARPKLEQHLAYFAEPTARMTAALFAQGAVAVGRTDEQQAMHDFGFSFGVMAYCLDAFEDLEDDLKRGEFNPLTSFYGNLFTQKKLSAAQADEVRQLLLSQKNAAIAALRNLDIDLAAQNLYASRLSSNLMLRVYADSAAARKRLTIRDNIRRRTAHAREVAQIFTNRQKHMAYYTLALAMIAVPRTSEYVEQPKTNAHLGMWAVFTALLAAIGLLPKAKTLALKQRAKANAPEALKKMNDGCGDCAGGCGDCCSGCGEGCTSGGCCDNCGTTDGGCCTAENCNCCGSCCAGCCQSGCCDTMCSDSECSCNKNTWPIYLIFFLVLAAAVTVALLLA